MVTETPSPAVTAISPAKEQDSSLPEDSPVVYTASASSGDCPSDCYARSDRQTVIQEDWKSIR
ncbi:hypothetical protein FOFC_04305 [Fusarium oxysporum]|nr:hypothetical protein FOFC_04305 [Fusarium oxysporum]